MSDFSQMSEYEQRLRLEIINTCTSIVAVAAERLRPLAQIDQQLWRKVTSKVHEYVVQLSCAHYGLDAAALRTCQDYVIFRDCDISKWPSLRLSTLGKRAHKLLAEYERLDREDDGATQDTNAQYPEYFTILDGNGHGEVEELK